MKNLRWHVITAEYPPTIGGVGDYTHAIAHDLASTGDEVHVWCPPPKRATGRRSEVSLHYELGRLGPADLRRTTRCLNVFPAPRVVFFQWVPHAYGWRSLNLAVCAWLLERRLIYGDHIELMVHEPFLPFGGRSWRHEGAAVLHRLMTLLILGGANRVWVSIPAWRSRLRPYALGRRLEFAWLPLQTTVPASADAAEAYAVRSAIAPGEEPIVGHFGTYAPAVTRMLEPLLLRILEYDRDARALAMGVGGTDWCARFGTAHPKLRDRLFAAPALSAEALSRHIAACTLMIQPYPDGISSRRTSAIAALAHGKPIVSNIGALTDPVWKAHCGAQVCDEGDGEGMFELARRLLSDHEHRLAVGAAAMRFYDLVFHPRHGVSMLRRAVIESLSSLAQGGPTPDLTRA
jgi:glycosyltransferase involved in cell wall biosynthesis